MVGPQAKLQVQHRDKSPVFSFPLNCDFVSNCPLYRMSHIDLLALKQGLCLTCVIGILFSSKVSSKTLVCFKLTPWGIHHSFARALQTWQRDFTQSQPVAAHCLPAFWRELRIGMQGGHRQPVRQELQGYSLFLTLVYLKNKKAKKKKIPTNNFIYKVKLKPQIMERGKNYGKRKKGEARANTTF